MPSCLVVDLSKLSDWLEYFNSYIRIFKTSNSHENNHIGLCVFALHTIPFSSDEFLFFPFHYSFGCYCRSEYLFFFSRLSFFLRPNFIPTHEKKDFRCDSFHCEFIVSMRCNCIVVDAFEWHFYVRLCHSEGRRDGEKERERKREKSINYMRLIFSAAVSV